MSFSQFITFIGKSHNFRGIWQVNSFHSHCSLCGDLKTKIPLRKRSEAFNICLVSYTMTADVWLEEGMVLFYIYICICTWKPEPLPDELVCTLLTQFKGQKCYSATDPQWLMPFSVLLEIQCSCKLWQTLEHQLMCPLLSWRIPCHIMAVWSWRSSLSSSCEHSRRQISLIVDNESCSSDLYYTCLRYLWNV